MELHSHVLSLLHQRPISADFGLLEADYGQFWIMEADSGLLWQKEARRRLKLGASSRKYPVLIRNCFRQLSFRQSRICDEYKRMFTLLFKK